MAHMNGEVAYAPLELGSLNAQLEIAPELYIDEGGRRVLYKRASLPLTREDCARLLDNGVSLLWIPTSQESHPLGYVSTIVQLPDEQVPSETKSKLLYAASVSIAQRAIAPSLSNDTWAEVQEMIETTVSYLTSSQTAFSCLLSAMRHDFSIYTHSVNVAAFALALGNALDFGNETDLRQLGLGAILHDIGKTRVPLEILNKPGPLSEAEWAIMRRHPIWGMEMAGQVADLPESATTIIGQHHERTDGSGYPEGLGQGKIHPFSTIAYMVDAYDALTSQRPYRPALSPYQAMTILRKEVPDRLPAEVYRAMVRLLKTPRHRPMPSAASPPAS